MREIDTLPRKRKLIKNGILGQKYNMGSRNYFLHTLFATATSLFHALRKFSPLFLSGIIVLSFWVFSRFTVDDAFISWRYGKNLIDAGIWNYNPAYFDITQAYTNPIFAALSIIPNLLGLDVVLFFKLLAAGTLLIFSLWFLCKAKGSFNMMLFFYSLPVTFIHVFSGMETFMFVALLSALFIYLDEMKIYKSTVVAVSLCFCRPEAWPLIFLVPAYFIFINYKKAGKQKNSFAVLPVNLGWRRLALSIVLIAVPTGAYFYYTKTYFGYFMPNTFYIASKGSFSLPCFIRFMYLISPLILLIYFKKIGLFLVLSVFFILVAAVYSMSSLMMDYAQRFTFHIFAPIYFFIVYINLTCLGKEPGNVLTGHFHKKRGLLLKRTVNSGIALFALLFFWNGLRPASLVHLSNYYPRALNSNALIGKAMKCIAEQENIASFSFGDAGMAAYHSQILAFDNIGLGSSAVAHYGIDFDLLEQYGLDVLIFHARHNGIRTNDHNQQVLYEWATRKGFFKIADICRLPDHLFTVYAKQAHAEWIRISDMSFNENNYSNKTYFLKQVIKPPWYFWTE